jgi:hypothetical protein
MQTLPFSYPVQNNPILDDLKRLADVKVDSAKNELEKDRAIIGYAHSLFTHDGDNTPLAADPLTILKEAKAGKSFRCVEYSTLAAGLLWAYGIPARTVGLKTQDVETREYGAGHVVIEFWSHDQAKWIMSDVQAGIIPFYQDKPLSAYELRQTLDEKHAAIYKPVADSRFAGDDAPYGDKQNYSEWIHEYLYFIDTPVELTLGNEDKPRQQIAMLVPDGVKPPEMFQGMFKMNAVYTNSVADFYPKM